MEKIDHIVWLTYTKLFDKILSHNLLGYFQDTVYEQVRSLLRSKHRLELEQGDEDAFKFADLEKLKAQLSTSS